MALTLLTAAGRSLAATRIFAGLPEEIDADTFARCWVLAVRGDRLEVVEEFPHPVLRAWMSANGTLYATSQDGFVSIGRDGQWTSEPLRDQEGSTPQWIFGFSGADPAGDVVFTTSDRALHIRRGGVWESHPYPGDVDMSFGLHGLSPDAVYVATAGEGLHKWNGREIEFVDMPFAEEPHNVLVVGEDDLVVTADTLHLRVGGEWQTPTHPGGKTTIALARLGDEIFFGTRGGIVRRRGDACDLVVPGFCNMLAGVGDAVLGGKSFENTSVAIHDGAGWRTLALP
jgi:hypothetical protein